MNPRSRAHRILRTMAAYEAIDEGLRTDELLGDGLGRYRNPEGLPEVEVFTGGFAWAQEGQTRRVRFDEIVKVEFPQEKRSRTLRLILASGASVELPVAGVKDDKFFDSLEMSRFISRCRDDLDRPARLPR